MTINGSPECSGNQPPASDPQLQSLDMLAAAILTLPVAKDQDAWLAPGELPPPGDNAIPVDMPAPQPTPRLQPMEIEFLDEAQRQGLI